MKTKEVVKGGKFLPGQSGNPAGRPKGSKNKVTLLKIMAEQTVRETNEEAMLAVANRVIQEALEGDKDMMKLVWQSIISKGSIDERTSTKEKVSITVNAAPKEEVVVINQPQEDDINVEQESN